MRKEFKVPFNGFYRIIKDRYYTLIQPMSDKEVKSISTGVIYGVGFDKIYKNFVVVYSEIEDSYIMYYNLTGDNNFQIGDKISFGEFIGECYPSGLKINVRKKCNCFQGEIDYEDYSGISKDNYCLDILDWRKK